MWGIVGDCGEKYVILKPKKRIQPRATIRKHRSPYRLERESVSAGSIQESAAGGWRDLSRAPPRRVPALHHDIPRSSMECADGQRETAHRPVESPPYASLPTVALRCRDCKSGQWWPHTDAKALPRKCRYQPGHPLHRHGRLHRGMEL